MSTDMHPLTSLEPDPAQDGVRLQRVDVFNWGTFDEKVWSIEVGGHSALLTGQIGAGKSSIVDAITTLVLTPSKIVYNKAAGASRDERDLYTYALGAYSKHYDDSTGEQVKRYLRKPGARPSVIQAVFSMSDGTYVTAGLILTLKTSDVRRPDKTYYLVPGDRTINEILSGERTASSIKAGITKHGGNVHTNNFRGYQSHLCKTLGTTPAALELFGHTVSMKEVADLTSFVRSFMLEREDMDDKITEMLGFYGDCSAAHDTVVDIRKQIDALTEVKRYSELYDSADERVQGIHLADTALPNRVNQHRQTLLKAAIDEAQRNIPAAEHDLTQTRDARRQAAETAQTIQQSIDSSGGIDVERATNAVSAAQTHSDNVKQASTQMQMLARSADLTYPAGASEYPAFIKAAQEIVDNDETARTSGLETYSAVDRELTTAKQDWDAILAALTQASSRLSNVPVEHNRIRDALAAHLDVDPDELPFAAELLQVRDNERAWEGAIERVARAFGITLLIPDEHLDDAARWVDDHNLGMLLSYLPVPAHQQRSNSPANTDPRTVAGKIQVRPDTSFTAWITEEVSRRFTHQCVTDSRDFRKHDKAVTAAGQLREGRTRRKDDRYDINDKVRYVLGWNTTSRAKVLKAEKQRLEGELGRLDRQLKALLGQSSKLQTRHSNGSPKRRRPSSISPAILS